MPGEGSGERSTDAVATHVLSTLHDLIAMSDREAELDTLAEILTEALLKAESVRQRLSTTEPPPAGH